MKRIGLGILTALLGIVALATPALATYIALPDSTPTIEEVYQFRNVLETGDWLIVFKENTPYASVPTALAYTQAYIWRLIDTDNTTELAQAQGYSYHESGYNYNIISFYLDSGNVTAKAMTYGTDILNLRLSGTPVAFASPPVYNYPIPITSYSSLTATAAVKAALSTLIIELATDLNTEWALAAAYYLTDDVETGTFLSIYGQTFFRGAIYGLQAMAPDAFEVKITDINTTARTWTTAYITSLETQYAGNYLGQALSKGETLLDVDYNLFGLLLSLGMVIVIIFTHWWLRKSGNIWTGITESIPQLVILTRMGVFGLGELCLIATVSWMFVSAKIWRVF